MPDQLPQQDVNNTAWAACDTFRGVIDPAQYKDYILVMLFLKYISDLWQDHYETYRKQYGDDDERIKVVLNRAGMDTGVREKDVERTLDTELWWKIPQDNEVVKAAQLGRPIVMSRPNSRVSLEIREIARALSGIRQRSKAQRKGGFSLGRFFKKSA